MKKTTKLAAAVELGRLGGLKGGKARALKLSPERRSAIARAAAEARWAMAQAQVEYETGISLEQFTQEAEQEINDGKDSNQKGSNRTRRKRR